MCLETHVADETDYNYAISFRTMSKLHLSSTVSLDFIILFGSPVLGDHNTGIPVLLTILV